MSKKKKIFLLVFLSFFLFLNKNCFAQVGIRASPLRFEEIVEPGQVLTKYIKITNTANESQTFFVYPMDFKAGGEGGQAFLMFSGTEEGPYLSSWIQTTKEGISFAPGEEKQIPVTFRVPQNIGPGGYYGAVVVGPQPPKVDPKGGVVITMANQVAVLALFYVRGNVNEEARIREFTTDRDFYNTPFTVSFITRVENLGNVHIKPVGVIEIKNLFGKTVATITLNPTGANVLPNSVRRFENLWKDDFGFGKYTASLILNYGLAVSEGGQGIKNLTAKSSFWILPMKIVIPGIIILTVFIVALFIFVQLYKNKTVKKALEEAGLIRVRYIKKYEGPSTFVYLVIIVFIILILIILLGGLFVVLFVR